MKDSKIVIGALSAEKSKGPDLKNRLIVPDRPVLIKPKEIDPNQR
jgi:hypothetical protein